MTDVGLFFFSSYFSYGLVIFRHFYFKYNDYIEQNGILTSPHVRGVGMISPIIFFLFLTSCYVFTFKYTSVDFNLTESYLVEYPFADWEFITDRKFFLTKIWPKFTQNYKIQDNTNFEENVMELFFNFSVYKVIIFFWWLVLFKNLMFYLNKCYQNIVSCKDEDDFDEEEDYYKERFDFFDFLYEVVYRLERDCYEFDEFGTLNAYAKEYEEKTNY